MRKFIDSIPEWLLYIIGVIVAVIAFLCYTPTTRAQSIRKINKTTVVVKSEQPRVKQDTAKTSYNIVIDDKVYPVYVNLKSGSMFIVRISQKTGKSYRCYVIKGRKIKDLFQ